ncbi:MAG: hydrogenase maturation nickel metallochaperone HypA [Deltaproteobacteria bacterium]|nr:hydrogenase maturation nickel metallochaperone HypA [Deltaproteobacteria bacterium]
MHEASIAVELLKVVEAQARQAGMSRVSGMKLRIGAFRMVVPELLSAAFEVVGQGTLAEGAEMRMETVPLVARCERCDEDVAVEDYVFFCPRCGAPLLEILSGKELDLVEMWGEGGESP